MEPTRVCRCCFRTDLALTRMKGLEFRFNDVKVNLVEGFLEISSIGQLTSDDEDPRICAPCQSRLQNAFSFKIMCNRADRLIRQSLVPADDQVKLEVVSSNSIIAELDSSDGSSDSHSAEESNQGGGQNDLQIFATPLEGHAFTCKMCGKNFLYKSRLRVHMDGHNQVRRYQCSKCNKSFLRSSHFNEHLDTHLDVKKFSCPLCQSSYRQRTGLKYHMKTHHKDAEETKCEYWTKSDSNRKKNKHRLLLDHKSRIFDLEISTDFHQDAAIGEMSKKCEKLPNIHT